MLFFFFFNDTATTEIYTLSLHDALPIWSRAEKFYRDLIYNLFPYPRRLRALRGPLRAYQASRLGSLLTRTGLMSKLPGPLMAMESLAPKLGPVERVPERTPAVGQDRKSTRLNSSHANISY